MNVFKRIAKRILLPNTQASSTRTVSNSFFNDMNNTEDIEEMDDWNEKLPNLIRPSIINFWNCYNNCGLVKGIIEDLVIKSISGWHITADNPVIEEYITDELKRLDIHSLMRSNSVGILVQGSMYYQKVIMAGKLYVNELAFDGENYKLMEVYDDETGATLLGYKQVVVQNVNTNHGWLKEPFDNLEDDYRGKKQLEFSFYENEIIATHFNTVKGYHQGIVEGVLDKAYMYEQLQRFKPQIVYKQANTLIVQPTDETLASKFKQYKEIVVSVVKTLTNFHRKGGTVVPAGFDVKLIGNSNLPDISSYLRDYKEDIHICLMTPLSVFEASSSNRSTAVVQLDSPNSGRVLFQNYLQRIASAFAQEIIDALLVLGGYRRGSAELVFDALDKVDNPEDFMTENNTVSTSKPGDGLDLDTITNSEGRLNEVCS